MRVEFLHLIVAFGVLLSVGTPSATAINENQCRVLQSSVSPWVVVLQTDDPPSTSCLGYIDPVTASEALGQIDQLPSNKHTGEYSASEFVVTFEGNAIPDAVEVSVRYGGKNANYIPITTCLAPDVVRLDNLPKNDTCSVSTNDNSNYEIVFRLPERVDTLEQLTISLLVHNVKSDRKPGDPLADVYQFVIVLNRVD